MRKVRLTTNKNVLNASAGDEIEVYSKKEVLQFYNLCEDDKDWLKYACHDCYAKHSNYTKTHGEFIGLHPHNYEGIGGTNEENPSVDIISRSGNVVRATDYSSYGTGSARSYVYGMSIISPPTRLSRTTAIFDESVTATPTRPVRVEVDTEAMERLSRELSNLGRNPFDTREDS